MAAAALACVHAVQALDSAARSDSNSRRSLLTELLCLLKVSSQSKRSLIMILLYFYHDLIIVVFFSCCECFRDDSLFLLLVLPSTFVLLPLDAS